MTLPLWTFQEIVEATGGTGPAEGVCEGVSIDSRTLRPGDLFIALAGENTDGHQYVGQAFERGASAALVSGDLTGVADGASLFKVGDTYEALLALARASRVRTRARIVGITGSVGKTGTKDALSAALSRSGSCHASERSYNNQIGVPLTLARLPQECEFGVLEMGMNHAGELSQLTQLARPHVAVITTVEAVHTEHFADIKAIADAKAEIFEGVETGGTAIINHDNAMYGRLRHAAELAGIKRIMSFGSADEADFRLLKYHLADDCSTAIADMAGQPMTYKIGIPGIHWVFNSLAVLGVVYALGADLGQAGLALGEMLAPKGRGRRYEIAHQDGFFLLIDESYNASPVSMRSALAELGRVSIKKSGHEPGGARATGRRIAVLGDMLELGDTSNTEHRALAEVLEAEGVDLLCAVGPEMAELLAALPVHNRGVSALTAAELIEPLVEMLRPGDVVMVKGSNALNMGRIVDALVGLNDDAPALRRAAG